MNPMRGRTLRRAIAQAWEAAEKRAAERGAATGHTQPAYRGLDRGFDEEEAAKRGAQWFSRRPKMAETYAAGAPERGTRRDEGATMLAAQLRLGRNLDVNAKGSRWQDIDARAIPDRDVQRRLRARMRDALNTSYVSTRELADAARAAGYDSVTVRNLRYAAGDQRAKGLRALVQRLMKSDTDDVYAVFRPENVRARHARFDPKRRDENNLLAGVTAATAIPAGAAAHDAQRRRRRQVRDSLAA